MLFTHADCDRRLLRRMALRNKFLSPTCPPGLGDVDTYFFLEKIFRSEIRICVTVASFSIYDITITHFLISDRNIFSKKKYVSTSPSSGAHFDERNLFLSRIRRSNRIKSQVRQFFVKQKGTSFVRTNHDAYPIDLPRRRIRCKSLFCDSETENGLREGTIMNYAPYLGAIRGEHVRAAARSIGAVLIEQPVLEACRCSREGNSEMG